MEEKSNRETHKSKEKEKAKNPINKYRIRVVILSFIVLIISCYFIYLTLTEDKSTSNLQINWRITTIIRLIISSFGYIGAVLKNKRLLIITLGLILIDLILSFGIYLLSFNKSENSNEKIENLNQKCIQFQ
jgi:glucose uptake protein GlcU